MKNDKYLILVIILVILLGTILSYIWIGPYFYKTTGDFGLFLFNPYEKLKNSFFTWNYQISTGVNGSNSVVMIPFFAFLAFFEKLGASTNFNQILLYSLLFIISGLSFFLINLEIADTRYKYLRSISALIFYIFNYFTLFVWSRFTTLIFIPAFCTLLIFLFYRGINTKKYFKYALLFNVASLVFSVAYLNLGCVIPVFLILIILFMYIFLINLNKKNYRGLLLYGIQISLFWGLLNLWWILPLFFVYKDAYSIQYSKIIMDNVQWLNYTSSLFKLKGLILLNITKTNFSLLDYLLIFIVPLIVAIPIFRRFRYSKKYLIFYFILFLSLFLMKGPKPPFGNIFLWLFNNVPGFQMFRWASEKFGIMALFSLPILFGFGIERLYELIRWKKVAVSIILLILIILPIHVYQIFTGSFMPQDEKSKVEVPSYYYDVKRILDEGDNYRIVSFPLIQYYYVQYNWPHGYDSTEDSRYIFNKPVISSRLISQPENVMPYYLPNTFRNPKAFVQMCSMFSSKYVFVNWDRVPYYQDDTPEIAFNYVNSNPYFDKVGKFGEIDVFKIKDEYFQNIIFSAKNVYLFTEDPEGLIYMINYTNFFSDLKDNAYIFLSQNDLGNNLIYEANKIIVSKYVNSDDDAINKFKTPFKIPALGEYDIYYIDDDNNLQPDSIGITESDSKKEIIKKIRVSNNNVSYFGSELLKNNEYEIKLYKNNKEIKDVGCRKKIFLVLNRNDGNYKSDVEFKKINNTKYLVSITNPEKQNLLVFSSTYDKNWEAIDTGKTDCKIIHIKANGFSNAWIIENSNNIKKIDLIIYYKPQRYFYYGLIFSSTAFSGLILFSIVTFLKDKKVLKNKTKHLSE
jgi:hypothetical protein